MNARAIDRVLSQRRDWLDQPVLRWVNFGIVIVGCLFWIEAQLRPEAFSEAIYGRFALIFPAEAWAAVTAGSSALVWLGLVNPVRRWMVAVGAGMQTVQYVALGYSAIMTGGEPVIGIHCTFLFAPLFAATFWRAAYDPYA